jgi:hypothetical protein
MIKWGIEDIQSISPMTDEEATVFLHDNLKWIEEAGVRAGWDAIEMLLERDENTND